MAASAQHPDPRGLPIGGGRPVVVVGAGIVGACCAVALLDQGWQVTLVDPGEPGGEQAASFGNGGWISPASVVPMSTPGLWRRVPGLLLDRDGPLTLRAAALPQLAPWLWRFVRAGARLDDVRATAAALAALLHDAPDRHERLAERAGVSALVVRRGLLYAYPDRAAFDADGLGWQLRREQAVTWTELVRPGGAGDGDPALDPLARLAPGLAPRYRWGAHVTDGAHCTDPGAYVAALVRLAQRLGARLLRGRVVDWVFGADPTGRGPAALAGVVVDAGGSVDRLPAQHAVLCAGIGSAGLATRAGSPVPMASERGYHLVLPWRERPAGAHDAAPVAWPVPVMPSDGRMAMTPTRAGLRLAGQVELAGIDAPPDARRVDVLWRHAALTLGPAARAALALDAATWSGARPPALPHWLGHRPSTPDGLPVIGPARDSPGVVLAFGHGHVGLAAGPATAALVADLLRRGDAALADAPAWSPDRFVPRGAAGARHTLASRVSPPDGAPP
jgi:D-amino-acid dehydrogenase